MFFHIPSPEYITLYNEYPYYGSCLSNISPWSVNTGLFSAILETQPPAVTWVSVGHNHGNDFYGVYQGGVTLGYGRKSGYASSNAKDLKVGARVFEISMDDGRIETWVREEDGVIQRETETKIRKGEP